MKIAIHNEIESDVEAISEVTKAAFNTLTISNHTEQRRLPLALCYSMKDLALNIYRCSTFED